jgi:hypothetical protein
VPLSEHEQRQFEAIERALYADDPKFAQTVRRRDPKIAGRRRLGVGVLVLVLGLATLLTGVVTLRWYVGVAGFVVMLGGALLGAQAVRKMTGHATKPAATGPGSVTLITERRRRRRAARGAVPGAGRGSGGGFAARLEERWQRRMGEQGR